mmetsp:Transcript_136770/g.309017  ORF Transcript_136770/g.309017 Transcript_136770/m.309017 type:complete len:169 (+) Transcript_136770:118-624(+)
MKKVFNAVLFSTGIILAFIASSTFSFGDFANTQCSSEFYYGDAFDYDSCTISMEDYCDPYSLCYVSAADENCEFMIQNYDWDNYACEFSTYEEWAAMYGYSSTQYANCIETLSSTYVNELDCAWIEDYANCWVGAAADWQECFTSDSARRLRSISKKGSMGRKKGWSM